MKLMLVVDGSLEYGTWSGVPMHIYMYMCSILGKENIAVCELKISCIGRLINLCEKVWNHTFHKKRFLINRNKATVSSYAKQIKREIQNSNPDVILSCGALPLGDFDNSVKIPLYLYVDTTLELLLDYYPGFANVNSISINKSQLYEKNSFICVEKTGCIFASSDWCKNSLERDYGIGVKSIDVVKVGAGIDSVQRLNINEIIQNRTRSLNRMDCEVRLLFVGFDYKRKGLDTVFEVLLNLKKSVKVYLDIVGSDKCEIPKELVDIVTVHGKLNKGVKEEKDKLDMLYKSANFFILPTKSECAGIVFADASSYGLPSITTVTGGIGSIVNNGINGFGFNPFNIENVCNYIIDYIKHPIEYEKLQYSSYEYYLNELNWDIICKKMLDRMKGNHNLEV